MRGRLACVRLLCDFYKWQSPDLKQKPYTATLFEILASHNAAPVSYPGGSLVYAYALAAIAAGLGINAHVPPILVQVQHSSDTPHFCFYLAHVMR